MIKKSKLSKHDVGQNETVNIAASTDTVTAAKIITETFPNISHDQTI